jgi:hypothetical protein
MPSLPDSQFQSVAVMKPMQQPMVRLIRTMDNCLIRTMKKNDDAAHAGHPPFLNEIPANCKQLGGY